MTLNYGTPTYRNNTFRTNLTEALRAHANHDLPEAARHYNAAMTGASNGYASYAEPLSFLKSQAESQSKWSLGDTLKHAEGLGFSAQLDGITRLIEDPNVKATYERYLTSVREGKRPVSERLPTVGHVDVTPTSRTKRPQ